VKAREAQILQAERAVQAKPNDPQASYNLTRVYAFYGKKEMPMNGSPSSQARLQGHQLAWI